MLQIETYWTSTFQHVYGSYIIWIVQSLLVIARFLPFFIHPSISLFQLAYHILIVNLSYWAILLIFFPSLSFISITSFVFPPTRGQHTLCLVNPLVSCYFDYSWYSLIESMYVTQYLLMYLLNLFGESSIIEFSYSPHPTTVYSTLWELGYIRNQIIQLETGWNQNSDSG